MNPSELHAMDKCKGRFSFLNFVRKPVQEKENSELKPNALNLKIEFVSHPDRRGGFG